MIKSISQWAFEKERPLDEVFKMAREHGFDAVEVAIDKIGEITPDTTEAECARIVESAKSAGVQLSSLASGLGWQNPMTTSDETARAEATELVAASLRAAKYLGVDAILCVPGFVGVDFAPGFARHSYDEAYNNALKSIIELAPLAKETGVTIGIENVWNKFLLSPLEMRDFIDKVGGGAGCYFDVGNVLLTGYPDQWIHILGERITRIHFKDFKNSVGTIDGFCDLLDGDVDYPAVMNALREVGYDGFVTAEFFGVEQDLAKISTAMDKILAM